MPPTDVQEPELREVPFGGSMLEQQTRGEIDIQIVTARRFPRSIRTFRDRAMEMATLTEDVAESCFYALPRDGKTVEGPSARLAEIVASAWGHMRIEGRVVGEDDRFVTARGTAWDLESNVAIAYEVRRRVTDKQARKFKDDMVGVTANAATSIALRNAVFKVVPSSYWRPIYQECRRVAVGDASTLADRRVKMLAYFQKMGVPEPRVLAQLGVKGVEDITLDHLATLKGLATAIKEGETTVDDAFAAAEPIAPRRASEAREAPASVQGPPPPSAGTKSDAVDPSAPNGGDLGTSKPAAVSTAPPPRETRGLRITHTTFVKPKTGDSYYEVEATTNNGGKVVFVTRDEPLYKEAASFEGTDHFVALTWVSAKAGQKVVSRLVGIAIDETTPMPPTSTPPSTNNDDLFK
jgi:hypothetical protein